jgi:hypothetical protein
MELGECTEKCSKDIVRDSSLSKGSELRYLPLCVKREGKLHLREPTVDIPVDGGRWGIRKRRELLNFLAT